MDKVACDDVSLSLLTATSGSETDWLETVCEPGLGSKFSHLLAMWWWTSYFMKLEFPYI